MRKLVRTAAFTTILLLLIACKQEKTFDATGSFETEEVIISSEVQGTIESFEVEEGQTLKVGELMGYIDSTQLYLKKKQLEAQINAVLSKRPEVHLQLASMQEQLKTAEKEKERISNLVKADAATQKQLDDINAQIKVIKRQLAAQRSTLEITSGGISKETAPLHLQIEQLDEQLKSCKIVNPINGTVLAKYAEAHEVTAPGKPLYKIANLNNMILRAYITGNQLPRVKIGQTVQVLTDDGQGSFKKAEGEITWISDKAEFTPKTVQTKDERANMVYAIKVKVDNDGTYKIGMYGELNFQGNG